MKVECGEIELNNQTAPPTSGSANTRERERQLKASGIINTSPGCEDQQKEQPNNRNR
jgi:hypothetical protein